MEAPIRNIHTNIKCNAWKYNHKLVNMHLSRMCMESNIDYLDNSNILLEHLQGGGHWGGIHLNQGGNEVFKKNFIDMINF